MSVMSICSNVLFIGSMSLLIFCLVDLSFRVSGVLKSPRMNALHSISPFNSVSISFIYVCAPVLAHRYLQWLYLLVVLGDRISTYELVVAEGIQFDP